MLACPTQTGGLSHPLSDMMLISLHLIGVNSGPNSLLRLMSGAHVFVIVPNFALNCQESGHLSTARGDLARREAYRWAGYYATSAVNTTVSVNRFNPGFRFRKIGDAQMQGSVMTQEHDDSHPCRLSLSLLFSWAVPIA